MTGRLYKLLIVAGAIAFVIAIPGCGNGTTIPTSPTPPSNPTTVKTTSAETVSPAEIERYGKQTPEHLVLEWWRTVQTNDPKTAQALYVTEPTIPNLAGQFNLVEGRLAGKVKIDSVKVDGEKALVSVRWAKPSGETEKVTIGLERTGGAWKLANVRFIDQIVADIEKAEAGSSAG